MSIMIEESPREKLLALVADGNMSVPAAAEALEVPLATAYRWEAHARREKELDQSSTLEQQRVAEKQLHAVIGHFYQAKAKLHAAIAAACAPPVTDPPTSRPLVKRQDIVDMTKAADPQGEGLTIYEIRQIVDTFRSN